MPLPNIMQSCSICGMEYENTLICTLCGGSVKSILKDEQDNAKSSEKKLLFDIPSHQLMIFFYQYRLT